MIKMFDTFRRWCEDNHVPPSQIEISIRPLSVEAAARLEHAWHKETKQLTLRPAGHQMPTEGHIYGIPFRYVRPADLRRPFGVPGDA